MPAQCEIHLIAQKASAQAQATSVVRFTIPSRAAMPEKITMVSPSRNVQAATIP